VARGKECERGLKEAALLAHLESLANLKRALEKAGRKSYYLIGANFALKCLPSDERNVCSLAAIKRFSPLAGSLASLARPPGRPAALADVVEGKGRVRVDAQREASPAKK